LSAAGARGAGLEVRAAVRYSDHAKGGGSERYRSERRQRQHHPVEQRFSEVHCVASVVLSLQ